MAEFSMQDVELMISEQRKYFFSGATKKNENLNLGRKVYGVMMKCLKDIVI